MYLVIIEMVTMGATLAGAITTSWEN